MSTPITIFSRRAGNFFVDVYESDMALVITKSKKNKDGRWEKIRLRIGPEDIAAMKAVLAEAFQVIEKGLRLPNSRSEPVKSARPIVTTPAARQEESLAPPADEEEPF